MSSAFMENHMLLAPYQSRYCLLLFCIFIFSLGFKNIIFKIAESMAKAAKHFLRYSSFKNVPIDIDVVKEPDHSSIGSGCGIM